MLTNIYNGPGIVEVIEDMNLALLHFSHELLQTPVLLQGICHLLGSHWPNGVLLQAVREERGPSAKLVTTIPRPSTLRFKVRGQRLLSADCHLHVSQHRGRGLWENSVNCC